MWALEIKQLVFEKLRKKTQIQTEFPTSHYYIMRAHIIE